MSLKQIKDELENYLIASITSTAIKFANTEIIQLNGASVNQDDQNIFIEPKIVPISSNIDLINTNTDTQYRCFFQIDIFRRKNQGMGSALTLASDLQALYKKYSNNDVVCENTNALGSFEEGDWVILPVRVTARLRGV